MNKIDELVIELKKDDKLIEKYSTWENFNYQAKNRKICLYGIGIYSVLFWHRCDFPQNLTYAVDGSESRVGRRLSEFVYEANEYSNLTIENIEILDFLEPEKDIVLIGSANAFQSIENHLRSKGFKYVYSIIRLEALQKALSNDSHAEYGMRYVHSRYLKQPIRKKSILFYCDGHYSEHGKYIAKRLLAIRNDLDICFAISDENVKVDTGIRVINAQNFDLFFRECITARLFISSESFPDFWLTNKREGQIYIHTKHWASITLKKFYLDVAAISYNEKNRDHWTLNGSCIDYMLVGSEFDEASCRRGFTDKAKYIDIGSSRSDIMFAPELAKHNVCSYYGMDLNDKFLLYAPTFRFLQDDIWSFNATADIFGFDFTNVLKALPQCEGKQWKILLRLHPIVKNKIKNLQLPDNVINVSDYQDGVELASACDALITDYSSLMFEPAFVLKPVFLFAPDKDKYINNQYELLIDYDSLPFSIAASNDELIKNIVGFDYNKYKVDVDSFLKKYDICEDGRASERAAEFISALLDDDKETINRYITTKRNR